MQIKRSQRTYLQSLNYNIPLKENWNSSLLAGVKQLATEIEKIDASREIHEIELTRDEGFKDLKAHGSFGYAVISDNNVPTDYSFIKVTVTNPEDSDNSWVRKQATYVCINNELSKIVMETDDAYLAKSSYDFEVVDDEYCLQLTAYFIKH